MPGCHGKEDTADPTVVCSALQAPASEFIPTVLSASFTSNVAAAFQVEYTFDGIAHTTPVESGASTEHSFILVGIPESTEVTVRPIAVSGGETVACASITASTGTLDSLLPDLTLTGTGHDRFSIIPLLTGIGPTIIDPQGRFVWFWHEDRGLDTYRARLSRDGRSILYNASNIAIPSQDSEIMRISLDGSTVESYPVPFLAHDFVELPDGRLGAIQAQLRVDEAAGETGDPSEKLCDGLDSDGDLQVDDGCIRGDGIVEVLPDGSTELVWTGWDCFDQATQPGDDPLHGWTFANALDYSNEDDAYYINLRNFSSIVKIPRSTFECEWVFGSEAATIRVTGGSPFLHEHQFELTDQGSIIVFDNEGAAGSNSRVIEYAFDPVNATATEIWSYIADPSLYVFVLGDVARFDDGDTLVTWSVSGQIDRVDANNNVEWQLVSGLGGPFGFNTVEASLYR